jgi:outer membrane protein TolC
MIHLFNTGKIRGAADLFLLVLMILTCTWGISSQERTEPQSKSLSPREAVDLAVKSNLSLESARISLNTKQRASQYVWNQFLPTVDVSGTLSRDNWPNTSNVMGMAIELPQWHTLGNFSASFVFSFALIAGIETIRSDYQAGLVSLEKAKLQLERDVRKAYNQILLLEQNAALLQENYANTVRQAAATEANFRAGLVPRLSYLQAQVAVENMKPTISDMENNLKALRANFAMSLGLPYDTIFILEPLNGEGFHIPLDLAELISKAASGKPDILELQRNIIYLQNARKAQALQVHTPYLRLGWTLSSTFNPMLDPFKDSLFTGDNWNKGGNFSLTLGISLNGLFPFTKEGGQRLQDLDNNIRSLNINLAQAIRGTELEIYTKVNSLEKTQTSAEVQMAAVELAELSFRLTDEAYRAGLQDFQAVQSSNLALQQARLQLLTQNFNYLNDLIDLEYAAGVPFGTLSSRY